MKKLILSVCHGNIHRSVIAELCIKKVFAEQGLETGYEVLSRGLQGTCGTARPRFPNLRHYNLEWRLSRPFLEEFGIVVPNEQTATPIDQEIAKRAALILVMDREVLCGRPKSAASNLVTQFPDYGFKMRLYRELCGEVGDFQDCFGEYNPEQYRAVIEEIYSIARGRFDTIAKLADLFSAYRKERTV